MSQLINEAFKELKGIDLDESLNEELFSFDEKGARDLSYFLDNTSDPVLDVIDPLATEEEELQPSYEGSVICQCCVCKQLVYKQPEDIVIDEETQNVNVGEECPHCYSTRGFKVIGQVEPYFDKDEVNVTVDDDEVEVESTEETSPVRESLTEGDKGNWTTVYSQFVEIVDKYFPDEDTIADKVWDLYKNHRGEADWDFAYNRWVEETEEAEAEEEEEEVVLDENGNEITSIQDARKWLNKQTEEYGNTYFFSDNIKRVLNKLVEVFGNTYFWFREGINEGTVKQGNKWVNKGKAGTHGTFKTKKAADAQRKAMFAQGYKGESLKENLDPALVTKMDKESFINYVTVRKGWTEEEAKDYLKTYFDEALDEKLTVEVTEEDINHFDEDTGDVIVDKTKFVGKDVQKGDYVTLKFTDENEDADTQDYKFVEETEDGFKLEWIGTKELHEDVVGKGEWKDSYANDGEAIKAFINDITYVIEHPSERDNTIKYVDEFKKSPSARAVRSIVNQLSRLGSASWIVPADLCNDPEEPTEEEDLYYYDYLEDKYNKAISNSIINKHKELHEDATDDFVETEYDPYKLSNDQRLVLQSISVKLRNHPDLRKHYNELEPEEVALDAFLNPDIKPDGSSIISLPDFDNEDDATDYFYEKIYNNNFDKAVRRAVIGKFKPMAEDFQKATVETGNSVLSMESDDSGKVTVISEPRKAEEGGDETIAPVSDEVIAEIEETNDETTEEEGTEETVEEETEEEVTEEEPTEEVEIGEFEESYFNELGKKYLQEVYNNVDSYETTRGTIDGNKIKLEGIISFKSGKKAKTEFFFEGHSVTKTGKIKFFGENAQITSKKNAFTLTGSINKGKLLAESLTYNYRAKDASTGKTVREYGTVKR